MTRDQNFSSKEDNQNRAAASEKMQDEIKNYLAAIGRRGGKNKSKEKTRAARENGKKGGRPKKRSHIITQAASLK